MQIGSVLSCVTDLHYSSGTNYSIVIMDKGQKAVKKSLMRKAKMLTVRRLCPEKLDGIAFSRGGDIKFKM